MKIFAKLSKDPFDPCRYALYGGGTRARLQDARKRWATVSQGLRSFIERCIPSFLAWDLVLLFANRQEQPLDLDQIKQSLAVDDESLREALEGLVEAGLLSRSEKGWELAPAPVLERELEEFLQATTEVKGRQRLLTYYLQARQSC